jgi:hypothetical protein
MCCCALLVETTLVNVSDAVRCELVLCGATYIALQLVSLAHYLAYLLLLLALRALLTNQLWNNVCVC